MCGIFGYVGEKADVAQMVLDGLKKLEYRGYDSWGVAVKNGHGILCEKHVGKIGEAKTSLKGGGLGLGHTRWATHGGVTDRNAHPHMDCTGALAVIHNGIVENYLELREGLLARGHRFVSETDTEVIAHLVEEEWTKLSEGPDRLASALRQAFRQLHGMNAVIVLNTVSDELAAAKNGSPLIVGLGADGNYVSSDATALLEHTRDVHFLADGEMAVVGRDQVRLFDLGGEPQGLPSLTVQVEHLDWPIEQAELGTYPHYMLKEVCEQAGILARIARDKNLHEQIAELARQIEAVDLAYMIGCGTAYNACLTGEYLFSRIAKRQVNTCQGSEFLYREHFINRTNFVMALSQSGETIDVIEGMNAAKRQGARLGALVNVRGSTLYRMVDFNILLGAGPEKCVLATKSLTAKIAILLACAYTMAGKAQQGYDLLARAADAVDAMTQPDYRERIQAVADKIHRREEHMFIIGRGLSYPVALEAALKIKEVSYIHAEGFAGGELKHGVIALIERATPCLVFAPEDETAGAILSSAMELRARGGMIIGVSPSENPAFDVHLPVANLGDASTIVNAIPAQLLGYYLALQRGFDPDKPRNLAKSVTVK